MFMLRVDQPYEHISLSHTRTHTHAHTHTHTHTHMYTLYPRATHCLLFCKWWVKLQPAWRRRKYLFWTSNIKSENPLLSPGNCLSRWQMIVSDNILSTRNKFWKGLWPDYNDLLLLTAHRGGGGEVKNRILSYIHWNIFFGTFLLTIFICNDHLHVKLHICWVWVSGFI